MLANPKTKKLDSFINFCKFAHFKGTKKEIKPFIGIANQLIEEWKNEVGQNISKKLGRCENIIKQSICGKESFMQLYDLKYDKSLGYVCSTECCSSLLLKKYSSQKLWLSRYKEVKSKEVKAKEGSNKNKK